MREARYTSTSFDADAACAVLDDETAAYIGDAREPFGILCQVVAQLAGLLLLEAAGAGLQVLENPVIDRAGALAEEASEHVFALRPPARAQHHHAHLMAVVESIRRALEAVERRRLRRADGADPLRTLRRAWEEIERASKGLPGFEPIDLSQSCCAAHMRLRAGAVADTGF